MAEVWRPVVGYEGLYEVSDHGRVRSYVSRWGKRKKPVLLKGYIGKHYKTVMLCSNDHRAVYIHRIVAEAFIPNPENKREVNHIDGNKLNNHKENLEWVCHSENMSHASRANLFGQQKKVLCVETGEVFDSITKAGASIGVCHSTMSKKIHEGCAIGGFHWELKGE